MSPPRLAASSCRSPNAPDSLRPLRVRRGRLRDRHARRLQHGRRARAHSRPRRALGPLPGGALQRPRRRERLPAVGRILGHLGERPRGRDRPERHPRRAARLLHLGHADLGAPPALFLDPRAHRRAGRGQLVGPIQHAGQPGTAPQLVSAAHLRGDPLAATLPASADFCSLLGHGDSLLPARGGAQPAHGQPALPRGARGVLLRDFAIARGADRLSVPAPVVAHGSPARRPFGLRRNVPSGHRRDAPRHALHRPDPGPGNAQRRAAHRLHLRVQDGAHRSPPRRRRAGNHRRRADSWVLFAAGSLLFVAPGDRIDPGCGC